MWNIGFFINSILLGIGLAMDAFSVSIANGLKETHMKIGRMVFIAGVYAFFQFLMPVLGWLGVNFVSDVFTGFTKAIPWIALILLGYIGGKMIYEGIRGLKTNKNDAYQEDSERAELSTDELHCEKIQAEVPETKKTSYLMLLVQGIATSIDALSTGFAISDYSMGMATVAALIIAMVTFIICLSGVKLGRLFGMKLADRATIVGGLILVFIGVKILLQ